MLLNCVALVCY